ncbi:MAG: zinc ribbon domain-containing protein, partial [Deltaproteobacteria bacterium]|nr:zinc ribbon domain-containing protein [Deltaproteobacteria bacterium]
MPIHEFKCKKCGKVFESLCLSSGDKDKVVCPSCGHSEVEPLISTFSLSGSSSGKGNGSPLSSSC